MNIDDILDVAKIIPVLEVSSLEKATPLAKALARGGMQVVEVTLRTPCALEVVAAMRSAAPELIVGVGTICKPSDVVAAIDAGAAFLVSPGASETLLGELAASGAPSMPGVATASESIAAFEAGFKAQKFFPAELAGGVSDLKALAGPLPDVRFCPTGGVSAARALDYLALPNVACVGGSWVATKQLIAESAWVVIEDNARTAVDLQSASRFSGRPQ